MTVTVSVTSHLDAGAIAALSLPGGLVHAAVEHAGEAVADRGRQLVYAPYDRVDTSFMAESIHSEMQSGAEAEALVGSDAEYDIYQHEGTSRGITPAPFMTDALEQVIGATF